MSPINAYKLSAIFMLVTMFMAVNCDSQANIKHPQKVTQITQAFSP